MGAVSIRPKDFAVSTRIGMPRSARPVAVSARLVPVIRGASEDRTIRSGCDHWTTKGRCLELRAPRGRAAGDELQGADISLVVDDRRGIEMSSSEVAHQTTSMIIESRCLALDTETG